MPESSMVKVEFVLSGMILAGGGGGGGGRAGVVAA